MRGKVRSCGSRGAVLALAINLSVVGLAGAEAPELVLQTGHSDTIGCLASTPDGRWLVTGSGDGNAILWDGTTGVQLRTFRIDGKHISAVAITPDGKWVLTGSPSSGVTVWDAVRGTKIRTVEGLESYAGTLALSSDGTRVLMAHTDKSVLLWELATGKVQRTLKGHTDRVVTVGLNGDATRAVTGGWDNTAIVWDLTTGEKVRTFKHPASVSSAVLSRDGRRVATATVDATDRRPMVTVWDAATGEKVFDIPTETSYADVAFREDGERLFLGDARTVSTLDAATGKKVDKELTADGSILNLHVFQAGRRCLVSLHSQGALVWDADKGEVVRVLRGHDRGIEAVDFTADGTRFLTASADRSAVVWDLVVGGPRQRLSGHKDKIYHAQFCADGRKALTASWDNETILWDAQTGVAEHRLFGGGRGAAVTPDGKSIVAAFQPSTAFSDNSATLWDGKTGKAVREFRAADDKDNMQRISSLALSRDGTRLLTGHSAGLTILGPRVSEARLWDSSTGKVLRSFKVSENCDGVAFTPDGKRLLTVGGGEGAFWDAGTGERLGTLSGSIGPVAAFSPDGRLLLASAADNAAALWDVASRKQVRAYTGHRGPVHATAFHPEQKRVLTGSSDGTARLWDLESGKELIQLITLDEGKDWLAVTPEGLFDGSRGGREKVSFRVGGGLTVVPVDRFFQDFYHPGLLAAIWRGESPKPKADFAAQVPPTLRITTPRDGDVDKDTVTVEVEATDQGGGVSGPLLYHNDTRLFAPTSTQKEGKTVRRTFTVRLVEGDNRIEARAASGDGSWESEPARVTLRYAKPLVKPDLYVLAVGVDKYADDKRNLKFAAADATALGNLFDRRGKAIYAAVHTTVLLDDKATRSGIADALDKIGKSPQPRDTFVLCLSGHGTTLGQRYYFLPHEFKRDAGQSSEEAARKYGIPADELGDLLGKVPALKKVLILDTCGSGGATGLLHKGKDPFAFRGSIERMTRAQGVYTIAAAAATEEAQEVQELGHGVLTYALLAGLWAVDKGPLDGRGVQPASPDQVADVLEWLGFASGQVPRLTKQYFGREQDVEVFNQGSPFPILPVRER